MEKTLEERLKSLIIERYGDVKTFSVKANIPNSTLNSMLQRGILNSTIGRIIQLSSVLNLSVDALVEGKIESKLSLNPYQFPITLNDLDYTLVTAYRQADPGTQAAVRKLLDIPEAQTESTPKEKAM